MKSVEYPSMFNRIRRNNTLLKVSAGAGLLAVLTACGTETAGSNPSVSSSISQEVPVNSPTPTVSETSAVIEADITDTEVLELTGVTTVDQANEAIVAYNQLFEDTLSPESLKDAASAYSEAVDGKPERYIKMYSVDKKEFLTLHDAQKLFLKSIANLEIPATEAAQYAELEGADFSYDIRVNAIKAYVFLSQYMIEKGTIDKFPESTKNVPCAEFGDPQDQLVKYVLASGVGGFVTSVTKDTLACNDNSHIYDTYTEYMPDFDQKFPNFAVFFKELKKAEQQVATELS